MNIELKNNLKAMGIVILISIAFYTLIFTGWNLSKNTHHKPTFFFWDSYKEGYTDNPVKDRYPSK